MESGMGIGAAVVAIIGLLVFKGVLVDHQFKENTNVNIEHGKIVDKRIRTDVSGGIGIVTGGTAYVPTSSSETFLVSVKRAKLTSELEVSHDQYLNAEKGADACIKVYQNKFDNVVVKTAYESCKP